MAVPATTISTARLDDELALLINKCKGSGLTPAAISTELSKFVTSLGTDTVAPASTHDLTMGLPPAQQVPASPPRASAAPVNTVAPVVSGTLAHGNALTTTNGTWTNSPSGYNYVWKSGNTIVGTNSNSYTTGVSDVGNTVTCYVTAVYVGDTTGPVASNTVGPIT